ncbi:hypothetical protein FJQ98_10155 [Lysinibacillus agricola]|uniref:Uncharacterized protein n=1 Tax=Lysinibacillus agricola TaxID=2590012 RepID=A0ABX7AWJ6_9BACI|nr:MULTISPECIES: hypothetical protein [Lysinibacillus]QQP14340.1 hypothetical protein FJQ98_10155 [Lysinibacillus agricola]
MQAQFKIRTQLRQGEVEDALQSAIAETILSEVIQSYEPLTSQEQGKGRLTRAFIFASPKDLANGASLNIAIQIMQNDHHPS